MRSLLPLTYEATKHPTRDARNLLGRPGRSLGGRQVGGFAQHGVGADTELTGECVEPGAVGFVQRGNPRRPVTIHPAHVPGALARHFDEIAQEVLFRFG